MSDISFGSKPSSNASRVSNVPDALVAELRSTNPKDVVIVSDMTQTLITQAHDGFTTGQIHNLSRLLDSGSTLVLVTADPIEAVKEHFLARLNYKGNGKIIVLSSAGYLGHEITNGTDTSEIVRGKDISLQSRTSLLAIFEEAIVKEAGSGGRFNVEEKLSLLSPAGQRVNIARLAPDIFDDKSAVDVFAGKCSIFFLSNKDATHRQKRIISALASDPRVLEIVGTESLNIFEGSNYLDILSSSKRGGLDSLFKLDQFRPLFVGKKVIAMGDSSNDEGLLTHQFPNFQSPSIRVFLGSDRALVDRMQGALSEKIYFLDGQYTSGSEKLLGLIKS